MSGPRDPGEDWDDARLDAAFAARAAAQPPAGDGLVTSTLDRLPSDGRPATPRRPLGVLAGLAGAAAAVAVVAVVLLPRPGGTGPASSSQPPGSTTLETGSPGPGTSGGNVGLGQLPVRSVSEALGLRDASGDAVEITVGGWLRDGVAVPCAFTPPPHNPTRIDCRQAHPWIVERGEDAGAGRLNGAPGGPAFQPSFALVDDSAVVRSAAGSIIPIRITGHFHDRRAGSCSDPDCDATFVVDRIDSVAGAGQPITSYDLGVDAERGSTSSGIEIPPVGPPEQDDLVAAPVVGGTVLGRRQMSLEGLLNAEPTLGSGWPGIGTAAIVTAVTVLDPNGTGAVPRARTFLVPDGSGTFFEMTGAGPIAAGSLPIQATPSGLTARVGDPITVSDAIAHRDGALDDTELLVEGQVWGPGAIFCTLELPGEPVLDQCQAAHSWIAEEAPKAGADGTFLRPTGPALNLVVPPESGNLASLPNVPAQSLVLGHFDDHRASSCPQDDVERCRRNFVVDAILDPTNPHLEPIAAQIKHPAPSNTPRGTADWAATAAGLPAPVRADRLISVFPVAVAALGALEPDAQGTGAMSTVETVWLVHFLDADDTGKPIVRTRIVVDGDPVSGPATVYDVTKDGLIRAWLAAAP